MKKLAYLFLTLTVALTASAQTARLQVIHNSADAAASMVDIYLDATLLLDDFKFRTATPFIDAPAGTEFVIGVAPPNSMSVADTIVGFKVTLMANETYVVVADGIVSPTGYSPSPAFNLEVYAMGREMATTMGNTDVLVHHGSTDAPTVDVVEVGVGAGTIVDDLAYTDFDGYLELGTMDYVLEIRDETGMTTVVSYDAPLKTLGLDDSAIVVVASGFLDPSMNSNGDGFGLYVALASGGDLVALPVTAPTGIEETFSADDWSIYPNPTRDQLNIELEEAGRYVAGFYAMDGRYVHEVQINGLVNTIDVGHLPEGIYMLRLVEGEELVGTTRVSVVR